MPPSALSPMVSAAGRRGRPGMVMISPQIATTKPAPAESRTSRTGSTWPAGGAERRRVGAEAVLGLGDADRHMRRSPAPRSAQLRGDRGRDLHIRRRGRPPARWCAIFSASGMASGIERGEARLPGLEPAQHRAGQVGRARPRHRPNGCNAPPRCRAPPSPPAPRRSRPAVSLVKAFSATTTGRPNFCMFSTCRARLAMPAPQRRHILRAERRLGDAAMHLQRPHGGDHHAGPGRQPGAAALDVEEFLRPEVGAEARLGHHHIGQRQAEPRRDHAVAAMRDIGEGPAMHQRRASPRGSAPGSAPARRAAAPPWRHPPSGRAP